MATAGIGRGRSCQTAIYVRLAIIITKKVAAMTTIIMVMVLTAPRCAPRGANSSKASSPRASPYRRPAMWSSAAAARPCAGGGRGRAAGHAQRQRPRPPRRRAAERDPDPHAALQARPHRHQARLRPRRMRQLHRDARRRRDLFLLDADPQRCAAARSSPSKASKGPNGELHPVQKAMIEELGPQCGFCTSGQVVSAVALLKHNPKPTVDEARHRHVRQSLPVRRL